jgi:hypothetical protein
MVVGESCAVHGNPVEWNICSSHPNSRRHDRPIKPLGPSPPLQKSRLELFADVNQFTFVLERRAYKSAITCGEERMSAPNEQRVSGVPVFVVFGIIFV